MELIISVQIARDRLQFVGRYVEIEKENYLRLCSFLLFSFFRDRRSFNLEQDPADPDK